MKFTAKTIMNSIVLLLLSNNLWASEPEEWADWTSTTSTTLSHALVSVSDDVDALTAEFIDDFFDSTVRIEEDLVALDVVDDAILDFQDKFSLSEGELDVTVLPEGVPDIGDLLPDLK